MTSSSSSSAPIALSFLSFILLSLTILLTLTIHQSSATSASLIADSDAYARIMNDKAYEGMAPGIVPYREWPFETEFPLEHSPPLTTQFRKCTTFPVLGLTCIEIYTYSQNLTLNVRLLVQGHVVLDKEITASNLCLDQKTLLQLLEFIPALLPFKHLIDTLIRIEGFIPAKLFSICLNFKNMHFTKEYVDGCANMDATLMCWKGECLFKGEKDFGCFHVVFGGKESSEMRRMVREIGDDVQGMVKRMKEMERLMDVLENREEMMEKQQMKN
eukprot:CAMPEP_0117442992 /NCGR_PEP_ID=MMETSP0759-20121206/4452_1 /TAXON_ID=63605 /ORGANISM="Percolomonas cosmopolitus, Strain WS" /LENGTH=271 /DNA_ID=CAMNT_0005234927 /DNA_START=14 /DNA_END=829 /DNA_ORIENTATION=+